jgi:electron transfer flavoprotein alpha subunit
VSADVWVIAEHRDGAVTEGTFELLGAARRLAGASGGQAVAVVLGSGTSTVAAELGAADHIIAVDHPSLAEFTPTSYVAALGPLLGEREPRLVLVANTGVGMDVAGGLSATAGYALAAYVTDIAMDDGWPVVTCQLYAGKIEGRVRFRTGRGICTVVAGSFPADAGRAAGSPTVETSAPSAADSRIRFGRLIRPETGDVDITRENVLVAVGRGIGEADNIELVEELASALGGAVAASRPIADAGWLPRSRQVGKSGQRVKPTLYLALGISGAPEHLEGMRDAELIIAVNNDPRAPIFGVAHFGATADLLDVVPALTARLTG